VRALATAASVIALAALASAASAAPRVHQLVVFRSGAARQAQPLMTAATASVRRRRCAVGSNTPLAALIHSGVGPLSLRDYGSCSKRAADAGGLFVLAIGSNRNRGSDGWVYKVGNVLATAGAGDPSGPFGRGRLRPGAHVTWFWCHVSARNDGCPHTLGVAASVSRRTITVRVSQFDDRGRRRPAAGATVHAGRHSARTGRNGLATLRVGRGRYGVWAQQAGRIRSFATGASVR
jgi:hypothetical protein